MTTFINWLREHKFESHLTAFLLMVIPAGILYTVRSGQLQGIIWLLLGIFVIGNFLAMIIR